VLEPFKKHPGLVALMALGTLVLVALPFYISNYHVSLFILIFANVALATAWAFFSGATRYISLATAAFFGIGIYALAIAHTYVSIPVALGIAAVAGFLVALVVGLATLRLRGVYFVVFTFGLTELIHQVMNWWEININGTTSRYIYSDASNTEIYLTLLGVAVVTIVGSWYVSQNRLGFALRAIGEDETVARHTGVNTTVVKIICFALSASVMALVGATLALRYTYIDATIAFNNTWSFQVLIAALLGGAGRSWGPALGAIPLVLLSNFLSGTFPHHYSIALGLCFIVIVYFLPGGLTRLVLTQYHRWHASFRRSEAHSA
jgi:branched-chain amino acid transport system permease protein